MLAELVAVGDCVHRVTAAGLTSHGAYQFVQGAHDLVGVLKSARPVGNGDGCDRAVGWP